MKLLAVIRQAGLWTVFDDGVRTRNFTLRGDAEEAALRASALAAWRGEDSSVWVQEAWGELRPLRRPHDDSAVENHP